jgi:transcriptional regulator with XRE-family HTH domain
MSTIEPMSRRSKVPPNALLRELRVAANLTQPELAREIGCSTSAVSRWESDDANVRRKPDLPNALRLSEVLKLSPNVWL